MRLGCYRDKTYCSSPNCKNKCNRKMSPEIKAILASDKYGRTSYANFCDESSAPIPENNNNYISHNSD